MRNHKEAGTGRRPSGREALTGLAAAGLLLLTGCDLGVRNPAMIDEGDLEISGAVPAIVNGARGAFGLATTIFGGGGVYTASALLTDELVHTGTWQPLREISDGAPNNESPENQSHWGYSSQARWQAEDAIVKAQRLVQNPAQDRWVALAAVYAGFSNRLMGDMFCDAVINGGPLQPYTAFHQRSVQYFTDALAIAAAGNHAELQTASLAGRAQARMMLGQWMEAVADAQQVPTSFRYEHIHSENSPNEMNGLFRWSGEGFEGNQTTVWGTPFAEWGTEVTGRVTSEGDPRVRYQVAVTAAGAIRQGGDNRRPLWFTRKYADRSAGIPLAKGTEMRLIEAEAALRNNDISGAVGRINEVRAFHSLPSVSAGTVDEAWVLLMKERGIELWLEGRRLPDLRRWAAEPAIAARVPFQVVRGVATGQTAAADPRRNVVEATPLCLRVSTNEIFSNPNLQNNPPR
jgi:hypothetical protein